MVKSRVSVAQFLEQQIAVCGRTQREIAKDLGYENPNIITMFKTGQTKVPVNKAAQFARAIGVDPVFFLKLVMSEYTPDAWETIEQVLGLNKVASDDELALLAFIRDKTGNVPIDISVADNQRILGDALKDVVKLDSGKAKAAVERYKAAPPNKRYG